MKFEELTAEDQALLNTELDPMLEKEAAEKVAAVNEVYAYGLEQGEAIADEFDKLAAEMAEEEEEEKVAHEETDEAAAELGSFIERGVFDSLTKLGSERHEDPMHYFYPYIEEKVAAGAAREAVGAMKGVWNKAKAYHKGAVSDIKKGFTGKDTNKMVGLTGKTKPATLHAKERAVAAGKGVAKLSPYALLAGGGIAATRGKKKD